MESIYRKIKHNLDILSVKNKAILVSLSGGRDSMTLLALLLSLKEEYSLKIYTAYINHNLRDDESVKEEKFIKKYIKKLNIPLFTLKINKSCWYNLKQESIEMAARRIRYDFLKNIIIKNNIDYIATGHNLNDRIETYFLSLFRAGGIDTLKSIPLINNNIIRPMLNITRNEINKFIDKNSIPFIEDSTNKKNIYKRNIIRNKIIPIFNEIHTDYEKSFIHIFKFLEEEQQLINKITNKYYKKILIYQSESKICIDKKKFARLDIALKKNLIKLILKKLSYPIKPSLSLFNATCYNNNKYNYKKAHFNCIDSGGFILFINTKKLKILNENISVNSIPFYYKKNGFIIDIQIKSKIDPKIQFSIYNNQEIFPITIRRINKDDKIKIENDNEKQIYKILKDIKIPDVLFNEGIVILSKDIKSIGFYINNYFRVSKDYYIKNILDNNIVIDIGIY